MPRNEQKRQKKLLKKRRKDNTRKQAASHSSQPESRGLIRKANRLPIADCFINAGWDQDTTMLTRIVITRQQPDGRLVFGSFLVDMLLLGVKDAHSAAHVTPGEINRMLPHVYPAGEHVPCDVALAHQIIYQSIDYAAQYDMTPHKDFRLAQHVLDPRGTHPETHALTFGKDGKPLFISGPHDNVDLVMRKLERTAGPGNYDYLVGLGSEIGAFLEDDDETLE
jgi:hypothetical protein